MAGEATTVFEVLAAFGTTERARAVARLLEAEGIGPSSVRLAASADPAIAPTAEGGIGSFFRRVVLVIVFWSIVGTAVGALTGWAAAQTGIGPGGTAGLILQIVSWGIFGHLIAGMWAGYALLADRSQRDFSPERPRGADVLLTVRCADRREIARARAAASGAGALDVREMARR